MNAVWLVLGLAHAGVVATPPPEAGAPTTLLVTDDAGAPRVGVTLSIVRHPGLPDAHEQGIGITDSRGRVRWTPDLPGPVAVHDPDRRLTLVAVGWPAPPLSVLVPFLLLGLAVAGMAAAPRLPTPRS